MDDARYLCKSNLRFLLVDGRFPALHKPETIVRSQRARHDNNVKYYPWVRAPSPCAIHSPRSVPGFGNKKLSEYLRAFPLIETRAV